MLHKQILQGPLPQILLVSSERLGKHLRLGTASIVNGHTKPVRVLSAAGALLYPWEWQACCSSALSHALRFQIDGQTESAGYRQTGRRESQIAD